MSDGEQNSKLRVRAVDEPGVPSRRPRADDGPHAAPQDLSDPAGKGVGSGFKYCIMDSASSAATWAPTPRSRKKLDDYCSGLEEIFTRLQLAPSQIQYPILAKCLTAKIGFLLRALPPHPTTQLAARFDKIIRGALHKLTGVHASVNDAVFDIAALPCRFGGLGLGRSWKRSRPTRSTRSERA
jgi:hypothetical protein